MEDQEEKQVVSGQLSVVRGLPMVDRKNRRTVVVATAPTEPEGAIIVVRLENTGIRAQLVGGVASGWRAESPGEVKVVVIEEDAQRAFDLLRQRG